MNIKAEIEYQLEIRRMTGYISWGDLAKIFKVSRSYVSKMKQKIEKELKEKETKK